MTQLPFVLDVLEQYPKVTAHIEALVDRLVHKSDIIELDGDSCRLDEAQARARNRKAHPSAT